MLVYQVFNNNIVLTYIEGKEVIILGTGIGFRKKKGDVIDESKIQKKFVLEDKQQSHEIASVFGMLSKEETEIILDIINDAISRMNLKISDSIYPSLADHIHYVIERAKSNLTLKCPLDSEVRYIYPQEYEICLDYVQWINEKFHVHLSDCEASSIVLHFLNAERDEQIFERTILETKIIKDIVDIVRMEYGIEFTEKNFFYRRFILHLQYFAKRIVKHQSLDNEEMTLLDIVKSNYAKAYQCAKKVEIYLEKFQHYKTSKDELLYLTIHIQKITQDHH